MDIVDTIVCLSVMLKECIQLHVLNHKHIQMSPMSSILTSLESPQLVWNIFTETVNKIYQKINHCQQDSILKHDRGFTNSATNPLRSFFILPNIELQ